MTDPKTIGLVGGVLVLLCAASLIVRLLRNRDESSLDTALLETFRLRVRAWWVLFSVVAAAILIPGQVGAVVVFGLMSFWALREFITLTPTRPGDHGTLFWVFFLFTPLQFVLVGMGSYSLYSILIPVYAFLFILAWVALAGDYKRFLERTAKMQAGLLICVYCLSYAPALLTMATEAPENQAHVAPERSSPNVNPDGGDEPANSGDPNSDGAIPPAPPRNGATQIGQYNGAALLFFFVLMVQLSDALQYAWSQIPSRHVIVPTIHPGKTWEGFLGGTASVTLLGAALFWFTPFPILLAAGMSLVVGVMGFAGGLTMSAIKRDRGVKDYGTLVEGHGGVLDRIDSICFAAPVFFHFTRFCLHHGWLNL